MGVFVKLVNQEKVVRFSENIHLDKVANDGKIVKCINFCSINLCIPSDPFVWGKVRVYETVGIHSNSPRILENSWTSSPSENVIFYLSSRCSPWQIANLHESICKSRYRCLRRNFLEDVSKLARCQNFLTVGYCPSLIIPVSILQNSTFFPSVGKTCFTYYKGIVDIHSSSLLENASSEWKQYSFTYVYNQCFYTNS